jgi:DNA-binding Lrp family transcriptional regulator
MVKRSNKDIKGDYKKILDELKKNGHESINFIAKKLGFSRQKVWRMIKELEKNKTIWGYTTITDLEKENLTHFILLIKRSTTPISEDLIDKIQSRDIEKLSKDTNIRIRSSYYLNGKYDWILSFTAKNIKQAKNFQEDFLKLYKDYVKEILLLENLLPIRDHGILNPEIEKIREFL